MHSLIWVFAGCTSLIVGLTLSLSVSLTLCCFVVYSTRRFVVCLSMCHFVLVFFSPFSIAITSLGEERANLSAFRTFVRFVLVWICQFPLPFGVWEGLRFVIVALPGLFSYLFLSYAGSNNMLTNTYDELLLLVYFPPFFTWETAFACNFLFVLLCTNPFWKETYCKWK